MEATKEASAGLEGVVAGRSAITYVDGAAGVLRYRGYEEFNLAETILDLRLPVDTTATLTEMVSTQKPLIVPDSGTYTGWKKIPGMEWLCAYLGVPLIIQGTVVGFLKRSFQRATDRRT